MVHHVCSLRQDRGCVPDFPGKIVNQIPVDVAGRSIVEILRLLQHPASGAGEGKLAYTVHSIANPHRMPWKELAPLLQSSKTAGEGKKLRDVSMVEWVGLLNEAADGGARSDELAASMSKNKSRSTSTCTNTSLHKGREEGLVFETAGSQRSAQRWRHGGLSSRAACSERQKVERRLVHSIGALILGLLY